MLCEEGRVSVYCFLGTLVTFASLFLHDSLQPYLNSLSWGFLGAPLIYYAIVNILIRYLFQYNAYQIAVRAALLGFTSGMGMYLYRFTDVVNIFGVYMIVMSAFHYTEFLAIAIIQPKLVTTDSFVINHSTQYTVAAISSWVEFFLEIYFLPSIKTFLWISYVGLAMCIAGDCLRKLSMLTAKSNFNHLVQCEKSEDHILVTNGVYSFFRHPSYVGWFYWSIGTQIILANPLCIIFYTVASWLFFNERVRMEEICLLNFFGQHYCDYQQKVSTGLPFINGYIIKP